MKYFAVHIEDLESERFSSATNDQVASWLFGHALCSKQMNGGTIQDAENMPERFWGRHGIDRETILGPSPLWSWSGGDLTFLPYDIGGQTLFEKKVKGGKAGSAKRWKGARDGIPKGSDDGSPKGIRDRSPKGSDDAYYIRQEESTSEESTQDNIASPEKSPPHDEQGGLFRDDSTTPPKKDRQQQLADTIYQEYPRKAARGKAIQAILKAMKGHDPETLLHKVKEYALAIKWQEPRFIPYPASWFNSESFKDDPKEWGNPISRQKSPDHRERKRAREYPETNMMAHVRMLGQPPTPPKPQNDESNPQP